MWKLLKILLSALAALGIGSTLVLGGAWLLAKRWDGRTFAPAAAQAGLQDVGWT